MERRDGVYAAEGVGADGFIQNPFSDFHDLVKKRAVITPPPTHTHTYIGLICPVDDPLEEHWTITCSHV